MVKKDLVEYLEKFDDDAEVFVDMNAIVEIISYMDNTTMIDDFLPLEPRTYEIHNSATGVTREDLEHIILGPVSCEIARQLETLRNGPKKEIGN